MSTQKFNRFFIVSMTALSVVLLYAMASMDVMNVDSSQYAYIAKEMYETGSYLQVYCHQEDYLDKPPLTFWLAALSYHLFGVHDWAYRLPSVLVLALGLFSLYRFARVYYEDAVAKISVLVMASTVATYSLVTDVRTDTLLTGFVMFSMWQLAEFFRSLRFKHMMAAALGIGLAMLAKGPLGLMIPVIAFSCEFIYKKQWKNFIRWQYIPALLVIAVVLFPMSYGLYQQYDLHPEKRVYGLDGPSGLRFFYWTQSFGRLTGENYWDNNPDPLFLYHSLLWTFMPWTVFFIPAWYVELREKIRGYRLTVKPEVITLAGFTLVLFFLSRSKYQLPHYSFVIHPLAALITARYLHRHIFTVTPEKSFRVARGFQYFAVSVTVAVCFAVLFFVFPVHPVLAAIPILIAAYCVYLMISRKKTTFQKTMWLSVVAALLLFGTLATRFYPQLLSYQADHQIARDINARSGDDGLLIEWHTACGFALDFYVNLPMIHVTYDIREHLTKNRTFILVEKEHLAECFQRYPGVKLIRTYQDFRVTQLTGEFLNPATRGKTLVTKYLLKY